MPRYCITIEYDGAPYCGWQRQDDQKTVQGEIERACAMINGKVVVDVFGSGRTDSGVHALGQIAHFDLAKDMRADKVRDALNFHLKEEPITVLDASVADDEFHARFDATSREYLYRIIDRRPKLALERGRVWRIPVAMDVDAMHAAAQTLIGKHDFTTFRDKLCQAKSPVKTLDVLRVSRVGDEIHINAKARSFLHRMVRSIVGSLAEVGMDKWDSEDMAMALAAKSRVECGPVSPPDGLYLVRVNY
jgi:tRNA pseudouridine38-40 synthase